LRESQLELSGSEPWDRGRRHTRDEAERKVVEAVAFTLEGDDDASPAQAEIRYLNIEIAAS